MTEPNKIQMIEGEEHQEWVMDDSQWIGVQYEEQGKWKKIVENLISV